MEILSCTVPLGALLSALLLAFQCKTYPANYRDQQIMIYLFNIVRWDRLARSFQLRKGSGDPKAKVAPHVVVANPFFGRCGLFSSKKVEEYLDKMLPLALSASYKINELIRKGNVTAHHKLGRSVLGSALIFYFKIQRNMCM